MLIKWLTFFEVISTELNFTSMKLNYEKIIKIKYKSHTQLSIDLLQAIQLIIKTPNLKLNHSKVKFLKNDKHLVAFLVSTRCQKLRMFIIQSVIFFSQ